MCLQDWQRLGKKSLWRHIWRIYKISPFVLWFSYSLPCVFSLIRFRFSHVIHQIVRRGVRWEWGDGHHRAQLVLVLSCRMWSVAYVRGSSQDMTTSYITSAFSHSLYSPNHPIPSDLWCLRARSFQISVKNLLLHFGSAVLSIIRDQSYCIVHFLPPIRFAH